MLFFFALFHHWIADTIWDAHYSCESLVTEVCELLFLFCVIGCASMINEVATMKQSGYNMFWFVMLDGVCHLVWIGRYLQICLYGHYANMRREAWTILLNNVCTCAVV